MFTIKQCHPKHTFFFAETYPSLYDAIDCIRWIGASNTTYEIYLNNLLFASVRKDGYRDTDNIDLVLYSATNTAKNCKCIVLS